MIAAKLATMKRGDPDSQRHDPQICGSKVSAKQAGQMLNVGQRTVESAKTILREGAPEDVAAVEKGEAAVSTTAKKIRAAKAVEGLLDLVPVDWPMRRVRTGSREPRPTGINDGNRGARVALAGYKLQRENVKSLKVNKKIDQRHRSNCPVHRLFGRYRRSFGGVVPAPDQRAAGDGSRCRRQHPGQARPHPPVFGKGGAANPARASSMGGWSLNFTRFANLLVARAAELGIIDRRYGGSGEKPWHQMGSGEGWHGSAA